ncbi:MAG: hypothetical protein JWN70_4899 [Planctomycetaceae bacterium]|nr:hypothetical protein [Planctomycetaceae bacterium]
MNAAGASPQITFRIPGAWSHPRELVERLPPGFRLSPEGMRLPDGTEIEFSPVPPDEQFPQIFATACRRPPTDDELEILGRYTVNVVLTGPGGSLESALTMMQAAAAIVRAGAAGVFIDNSAMAHGGDDWIAMTEDGGPDAISFAFTSIIRGEPEIYTMGMQVMGFPDLLMRSADVDERGETIVEIIRYLCGGDRPIDIGHMLADENGPRFQVVAKEWDEFDPDSSMHNPYGRLKVANVKDIAEGN